MILRRVLFAFMLVYIFVFTAWHSIYKYRNRQIRSFLIIGSRKNSSYLALNTSYPSQKDTTIVLLDASELSSSEKLVEHDAPEFEELPPLVFTDWEEKYLGWQKFRSWMDARRTICQGHSRIECAMLPEHTPRKAYFCFGTDIVQQSAPDGRPEWLAFCEWTLPAEERAALLEDMDPLNALTTGALRPAPLPAARNWTAAPRRLTYLAYGDCNTGNPGHCIADPHNFLVARRLLGVPARDAEVRLVAGFGENIYTAAANSTAAAYDAAVAVAGTGGAVRDLPFVEDWLALAGAVGRVRPAPAGGELLPLVVVSALGMHGPHWRAFKDVAARETQQGRSQARRAPPFSLALSLSLFLSLSLSEPSGHPASRRRSSVTPRSKVPL